MSRYFADRSGEIRTRLTTDRMTAATAAEPTGDSYRRQATTGTVWSHRDDESGRRQRRRRNRGDGDTERPRDATGADIGGVFPRSASGSLRATLGGDLVTADSLGECYPEIDRWLAVDVHVDEGVSDGREGPDENGRVPVYVRDRTGKQEAQRRVEGLERCFDRVGCQ
jgi:hypothetical protein